MRYGDLHAQLLPIGAGVVEAACKTLVSQQLTRSGMRWRVSGGQAILAFRVLWQSERFERAWPLLVETYKQTVTLPGKVIALRKPRERELHQCESYTLLALSHEHAKEDLPFVDHMEYERPTRFVLVDRLLS
jgi:hypothetical protein